MTATFEARLPGSRDGESRDREVSARGETGTERQSRWVCRTCHNPIAERSAQFAFSEAPQVFSNPHGIVFEIVTVREASGLVSVGPSSAAFSWFAGYAWCSVCCSSCLTHLGWQYTAPGAASPPTFFGLIVSELAEEAE